MTQSRAVATERVVARQRRRGSGTAGDAVGLSGKDRLGLCCCVIEGIAESVGVFFLMKNNAGAGCLWDSILVMEGLRGHRACGGAEGVR